MSSVVRQSIHGHIDLHAKHIKESMQCVGANTTHRIPERDTHAIRALEPYLSISARVQTGHELTRSSQDINTEINRENRETYLPPLLRP